MNAAEAISLAYETAKNSKKTVGLIRKSEIQEVLDSMDDRVTIYPDGTMSWAEDVGPEEIIDSDWVLVSDLESIINKALEDLK